MAELEPGVNAYIGYDNGVRAFLGGMKANAHQISVDMELEVYIRA